MNGGATSTIDQPEVQMKVKFGTSTNIAMYALRAKIWKFKGSGGWHPITLPKGLSKKVREIHGPSEEGWGRLKKTARIGESEWKTAIWYDSNFQSYLLPVKASVRKAENVGHGVVVSVKLLFHESHF